jgi:uncharacterized OB-fold protein
VTEQHADHALPPHAAPLAEGARAGALRLQRCSVCGAVPEFPRIACPRCLGELEWTTASGHGHIVSFTIVRRAHRPRFEPELPIVLAVVELAEGPQIVSSLVGAERLEARIGAGVVVTRGWSELPQFRLALEVEPL